MQEPISGFIRAIKTGFGGKSVKPGSIISFTVDQKLSGNSWSVLVSGQKIKVVSALNLQIGQRIRARVLSHEGRLVFKVLSQKIPIAQILEKNGLPVTDNARLILKSFISQGLPLREELLKKSLQLYESNSDHTYKSARLIALLIDKGLLLTERQLQKFRSILNDVPFYEPESYTEQKKDKGNDENRNGGNRRNRHEKDRRRLTDKIRSQMNRASDGENLLQLFNHLEAPHDNWIVIPLSFDRNIESQAPEKGIVRLHTSLSGEVDAFSLSIFGIRDWHFSGKLKGDVRNMKCAIQPLPSKRIRSQIVTKLNEKLRNLSYEIDDTISEVDEFSVDGGGEFNGIKNIDTMI